MAMFELRTLRDVIRALPEEFRRRFAREIASGHGYPGLRIDVVAAWPRIQALDVETATRDDVIAAFGSPVAESWVYFDCEACKKQVDAIAIIEVYSSESGDVRLCRECCTRAMTLFPVKP